MSEADNNSQGKEPRTSQLAIASAECMGASVACGILLTGSGPPDRLSGVLLLAGFVCAVAALVLGYVALEKIKESDGLLTGKGYAIAGMSGVGFYIILGLIMPQLGKSRPLAQTLVCGTNLKGLAAAMVVYGSEFDDKYPTPDKWCDLLVEYAKLQPKQFMCKASGAVPGESSYAFNRNLVGRKLSEISGDMVLLFETNFGTEPGGRQEKIESRYFWKLLSEDYDTYKERYARSEKVYKLRWNQYGGPEILATENHDGKGCNILFNDGHVEYVPSNELELLKWKVEQAGQ